MEETMILSLPTELQECVIRRVCKKSLRDFMNLKRTCKTLKEVSELSSFYASVDLDLLTYNQLRRGSAFMTKCYENGNLTAIYIKGVQDYFMHDKPVEGLRGIKMAADGGCDVALYTYVMIRKTFLGDDVCSSPICRETVKRITYDIAVNQLSWDDVVRVMAPRTDEFLGYALPMLYGCNCSVYSAHKS